MALENKAQKAKREAMEALPRIVAATQGELGYTFCTVEIVEYLQKHELAEGNAEIFNEAGAIATRATTKGIEKVMSETATAAPAKIEFVIEDGVELPVSKRGGKRESVYPFDLLTAGQSFFIPASEKHPEPAKSLASTVSGATKRFDVPDLDEAGVQKTKEITVPKTKEKRTVPAMKHTRVFVIRAVEGGARVFRTV